MSREYVRYDLDVDKVEMETSASYFSARDIFIPKGMLQIEKENTHGTGTIPFLSYKIKMFSQG